MCCLLLRHLTFNKISNRSLRFLLLLADAEKVVQARGGQRYFIQLKFINKINGMRIIQSNHDPPLCLCRNVSQVSFKDEGCRSVHVSESPLTFASVTYGMIL